jgi:uncharacterized surface protein with fasciclin (FAS1) repeats
MQTLKTPYSFLSILFFFAISVTVAQNKYLESEAGVITKKLVDVSINSNLSIKENLSQIASFSHLQTIYNLIGFEDMIKNEEMVTVFVSDNNALAHMGKEELKTFLSASNKTNLKEIISYYIIPGRVDEHAIRKAITDGNGAASFRVLDGKTIRFLLEGETIYLYAPNGSRSKLLNTNYRHNKGFFHITDGLAIPQGE